MKKSKTKITVGPNTPPTDEVGRWERGLSPWHQDAFPGEFKSQAPERNKRKSGWFEVDWWKNIIGWVPDGTRIVDGKQVKK